MGLRLLARLEHDLTYLDYVDFSLKDSNNTPFAVTGVTKISRNQILFSTADFNNAYENLTLIFVGSGSTKGEAGQNVNSFSRTFTPINLVPTSVPLPGS